MATTTVNLDALIRREDIIAIADQVGGKPRSTFSLPELEPTAFFQNSLRKPDFQRETTHWTPNSVYEIVRAFLDGDLIPAVILWQSGNLNFVLDGAHRLSALMAWVRDDYGDGADSSAKFGSAITHEQKKVAAKTRALLRTRIGAYSEFRGLVGQSIPDPQKANWVSRIGSGAVDIQWVTAKTLKAAEDSFFKINQAAVPIDPTERQILQNRRSAGAIAARCIARGGAGHKYWSLFSKENQEKIEELGSKLNETLFQPPTASQPVTTTDLPIAGQGYNNLPFLYELVCFCNGIVLPSSQRGASTKVFLEDTDGESTIQYMQEVKRSLQFITTNVPGSLGLHPLVYYYSSSGNFQANSFLATIEFARILDQQKEKKQFIEVRAQFEEYLLENREFVTLTMSRLGAGARSLKRIVDLYVEIFRLFKLKVEKNSILDKLIDKSEYKYLRQSMDLPPSADFVPSKNGASKQTKSASFIAAAMRTAVRCHICGAAIHMNSMTFDHIVRKSEGGSNRSENIKPAHPFCNSGIKS